MSNKKGANKAPFLIFIPWPKVIKVRLVVSELKLFR